VVLNNFRSKSVAGLSLDSRLFDLVGFCCYFISNAAMYWSPVVQQEYQATHEGHSNTVKLNDVFFAGHNALLTVITLLQISVYYDYPPLDSPQRVLRGCVLASLSLLVFSCVGLGCVITFTCEGVASWLWYFMALAQIEVVTLVPKYAMQVQMNYSRKRNGIPIEWVLLDLMGSVLSITQLTLDCWAISDWSAMTGNLAKLLIGILSLSFDAIFLVQHFVLYAQRLTLAEL